MGIAHVAKETGLTRQEAVWLGEVEPDDAAAMEGCGGIQCAGHEADGDTTMTRRRERSPTVTPSTNGRIT
jgi:hypothetical protein